MRRFQCALEQAKNCPNWPQIDQSTKPTKWFKLTLDQFELSGLKLIPKPPTQKDNFLFKHILKIFKYVQFVTKPKSILCQCVILTHQYNLTKRTINTPSKIQTPYFTHRNLNTKMTEFTISHLTFQGKTLTTLRSLFL